MLDQKLFQIGNLVHPSVPVSDNEVRGVSSPSADRYAKDNNVVVRAVGERRPHTDDMHHHHELLYMIDGYEPKPGPSPPHCIASFSFSSVAQELRLPATAATSSRAPASCSIRRSSTTVSPSSLSAATRPCR